MRALRAQESRMDMIHCQEHETYEPKCEQCEVALEIAMMVEDAHAY